MLVPVLCVLNLTKCNFFVCLKLRLFQGFKIQFFWGAGGLLKLIYIIFLRLSNSIKLENKKLNYFGGGPNKVLL